VQRWGGLGWFILSIWVYSVVDTSLDSLQWRAVIAVSSGHGFAIYVGVKRRRYWAFLQLASSCIYSDQSLWASEICRRNHKKRTLTNHSSCCPPHIISAAAVALTCSYMRNSYKSALQLQVQTAAAAVTLLCCRCHRLGDGDWTAPSCGKSDGCLKGMCERINFCST